MNAVDSQFWQGKRVFLTGHTGFKGSWLSLWLKSMGATLRGVSLAPPTEPALFEIASVAVGMDHCIVDIRDFAAVNEQMSSFNPEIVIHMAAQPLVRLSYEQPISTYATNVLGTVHILEAARNCGSVKAILNVTTDKCYENREWEWGYRETDPMGGHDPYSSSKGCVELVSAAYRNSFLADAGIGIATARAGNVIGGGDWAKDRLLPDILYSLERNKTITIRNPSAIRPWQHVLEPLSGYIKLAESLYNEGQLNAQAWNFGPYDNDARSVQWIVERMCEKWGRGASWDLESREQLHEARFLKLDASKAREYLNWAPKWSIETALSKVIEWHQMWLDGEDMEALCRRQITQYMTEHD